MRISTKDIFDPSVLIRNQADLNKTQIQISTGRRIVSPADDPVGAAEALRLRQSSDLSAQYQANQQRAQNTLGLAESALGDVTSALEDVRTSVIAASNGTLSDSDRKSIAQDIAGRLEQMLQSANSANPAGGYLFGGYRDGAAPFCKVGGAVVYNGDQGGRTLQVTESRAIEVSNNGSSVFEQIKTGNGTFTTSAASTNTGTGIVGTGQVVDPAALTGHTYQVQFSVVGGVTTYGVVDTTPPGATPVAAGQPYTSGSAISFDGVQLSITGKPANSDSFTVAPAASQSVFTTVQNVVKLLNSSTDTAAARSALANGLAASITNIDNAYQQVLAVRSSLGSRMQEIDGLQSSTSARDTAVQAQLSQLEDVDYAAAVSMLSRQQLVLEAAQKAYVGVTKMSLFSLL